MYGMRSSPKYLPLVYVQTLEMFRVFPVILWEKRETIWGESCSMRTALTPLLSLRTTTNTLKNKT